MLEYARFAGRRQGVLRVTAVVSQRFVVDTMLGRLARWLRAMGYDTLYPGSAEDARLLEMAHAERRILLTRDAGLAQHAGALGCLVRAERLEPQLAEVIATLGLAPSPEAWLSRCLECNGSLEPRDLAAVVDLVPERVRATQADFTGCPSCGRIYWPGSHADRIVARLTRLLGHDRPA